MRNCDRCGTPTTLFLNDAPICKECGDTLESDKKLLKVRQADEPEPNPEANDEA